MLHFVHASYSPSACGARLSERGVREEEVTATVLEGERFPARLGRVGFRRNFNYESTWRGKVYATQQVEVIAVEEPQQWVVITVIARYF